MQVKLPRGTRARILPEAHEERTAAEPEIHALADRRQCGGRGDHRHHGRVRDLRGLRPAPADRVRARGQRRAGDGALPRRGVRQDRPCPALGRIRVPISHARRRRRQCAGHPQAGRAPARNPSGSRQYPYRHRRRRGALRHRRRRRHQDRRPLVFRARARRRPGAAPLGAAARPDQRQVAGGGCAAPGASRRFVRGRGLRLDYLRLLRPQLRRRRSRPRRRHLHARPRPSAGGAASGPDRVGERGR